MFIKCLTYNIPMNYILKGLLCSEGNGCMSLAHSFKFKDIRYVSIDIEYENTTYLLTYIQNWNQHSLQFQKGKDDKQTFTHKFK